MEEQSVKYHFNTNVENFNLKTWFWEKINVIKILNKITVKHMDFFWTYVDDQR